MPVSRELVPVLIPRRVLQTHQFLANFTQAAAPSLAQFSTNGQTLAVVTPDKTLQLIDVSKGGNAVTAVPNFGAASVSTDGRYLLGQNDAGEVSLLDLDTKDTALAPVKFNLQAGLAAIAPNSRQLLVYLRTGKGFRLLNLESGALMAEFGEVDGEPRFAFSPSGHRLLTWGSNAANMVLWDGVTGKRIAKLTNHWKPVTMVAFSSEGDQIFTAAFDDRMIVWNSADGEQVRRLNIPDKQPVPSEADFLADGKGLLLRFKPGKLAVWDVPSGRIEMTPDLAFAYKQLVFSPDRQRIYASGTDGHLRVIDMTSRTLSQVLPSMDLVGLSAEGKRLVAQDAEGLRLFDALSLAPVMRWPGQTSAFLSPKNANSLVTSSNDGKLSLWSLEYGALMAQLKGHQDTVTSVVFSNDLQHFASVSNDRSLKLWGLPQVSDMASLVKDPFETTAEYTRRAKAWVSSFAVLVGLGDYNADSEQYSVRIGDATLLVPLTRDDARKLAGQRQALLRSKLKFFDGDQLQMTDSTLARLP
jgi:WD40 repeat protein